MIIKVSSEDLGIKIERRERSRNVNAEDLYAKPIRFEAPNPWTPIHDGSVVDAETLLRWERGIPRHCKCVVDYREYKRANPPDLSSPRSIWIWGFELHNWVNEKLDPPKPRMTIEEAVAMWNPPFDVIESAGSQETQ